MSGRFWGDAMINRTQVSILVTFALFVAVVVIFIQTGEVQTAVLTSAGVVVSASVIAISLFDRFLWKLPVINGLVIRRPILAGEWKYVVTAEGGGTFTARALVDQTSARFLLTVKTGSSQSYLEAGRIEQGPDGQYQIHGVFHTTVEPSAKHRRPDHKGQFGFPLSENQDVPLGSKGSTSLTGPASAPW